MTRVVGDLVNVLGIASVVGLYLYGMYRGWRRTNFVYLSVVAIIVLGGFLTLTGWHGAPDGAPPRP
jgi:hypothetical protein